MPIVRHHDALELFGWVNRNTICVSVSFVDISVSPLPVLLESSRRSLSICADGKHVEADRGEPAVLNEIRALAHTLHAIAATLNRRTLLTLGLFVAAEVGNAGPGQDRLLGAQQRTSSIASSMAAWGKYNVWAAGVGNRNSPRVAGREGEWQPERTGVSLAAICEEKGTPCD